MLICSGVFVSLGEAEVDNVDVVLSTADPDQVVVRLDVPVEEATRVYVLDALD